VYLNDLAHTGIVEFGHVLPEPLGEQAWVEELVQRTADARQDGRQARFG